MQFDLRKFIVSGTKPYAAEFQCDLSAKVFCRCKDRAACDGPL